MIQGGATLECSREPVCVHSDDIYDHTLRPPFRSLCILARQVVQTAWAMLTLVASEQWQDREDVRHALARGAAFLR